MLTLGLLIPLTTGDYDLSVAGVLSLSAMLLGVLNAEHHMSVLLVILICLGMGALVGAINGAFVIGFEIDPFIVTLGTGTLLSGIVLWISHSNTISGISDSLSNAVVVDRFLGIPLEFFYALALCLLVWYFFEFTVLGRRLLFVGRSKSVARLSGLRVNRLRWGALVASGLISAFAGVLYAGTLGAADPTSAPILPAARVRRRLPRRDRDPAWQVQPLGLLRRRLLPRHGDHGPVLPWRGIVHPGHLLRLRARDRGRALARRAPQAPAAALLAQGADRARRRPAAAGAQRRRQRRSAARWGGCLRACSRSSGRRTRSRLG